LTIQLTVVAIVLGFVVGTLCAVLRVYGGGVVRRLVGGYVEIIRNTPLLVQIFIVYFGLASVGLKLSAELSAIIALVINVGAYTTEIMRAGIESIGKTQLEAADCLGLTRLQTIFHIVLLPAMERVFPALSSQFVLLMLASSVTSQISAEELTATANLIQSETYRSFEVYVVVAVVYLALSFLYRFAFWLIGQLLFVRRRKLGTAL
jgi:polar amino acid transport system permease protein